MVEGARRTGPAVPVDSGSLLDALLRSAAASGEAAWWLGVADAPLRNEVFGEATVGGPAAVISLHPLAHPDPERHAARVLTSAVHELGHVAGLEHCAATDCAMYPSRTTAETDEKGPGLCPACEERLRDLLARGA